MDRAEIHIWVDHGVGDLALEDLTITIDPGDLMSVETLVNKGDLIECGDIGDDLWEIAKGAGPIGCPSMTDDRIQWHFQDADGDGLTNGQETELGTSIDNPDTDSDSDEVNMGKNATNPDSDSDGRTDGEEEALGTDPNCSDSDGDGYSDKEEADAGTVATDPDDNSGNDEDDDDEGIWHPANRPTNNACALRNYLRNIFVENSLEYDDVIDGELLRDLQVNPESVIDIPSGE